MGHASLQTSRVVSLRKEKKVPLCASGRPDPRRGWDGRSSSASRASPSFASEATARFKRWPLVPDPSGNRSSVPEDRSLCVVLEATTASSATPFDDANASGGPGDGSADQQLKMFVSFWTSHAMTASTLIARRTSPDGCCAVRYFALCAVAVKTGDVMELQHDARVPSRQPALRNFLEIYLNTRPPAISGDRRSPASRPSGAFRAQRRRRRPR